LNLILAQVSEPGTIAANPNPALVGEILERKLKPCGPSGNNSMENSPKNDVQA
jgi:hypothetical protein